MKLLFLISFLTPFTLNASTWYVRPSAHGAANGTAYDNAWGGITSIVWPSVSAGDTIYICGTNILAITGASQYVIAGVSQIAANSITIRGDYPGDAGVLFGGCYDAWHTITWTGPDANSVYWSTNFYFSPAYRRVCFEIQDGWISYLPIKTNTTWLNGSGAFFDGVTNWVRTSNAANPGTNVLVYNGGYSLGLNGKTNLAFRAITFLGRGIYQTGNGYWGTAGQNYEDAPRYIMFENCRMIYQTGISMDGGQDHWTFSGCEMSYGPFGVYATHSDGNRGPDSLIVTNCHIHHTEVFPGDNEDLHALGLQAVCNSKIVSNRIHDTGGTAIDFYSAGLVMTNNEIKFNWVQNIHGTINSGSGIVIDSHLPYTEGNQIGFTINCNIVDNIGIDGTYGWNAIGVNCIDPIEITANTLSRCGTGIDIASGGYPVKATVLNNIIVSATNKCLNITGTGAPDLICDYNLIYDSGEATVSPPSAHDSHSVAADPLFLDASYHIQNNSPARGAGTPVGLATDYAGRPWRNPPSIGAYEYWQPSSVSNLRVTTLRGK